MCPTPSLAGVDLSLTREQMPPLLGLLRFLSSQSCYLAHDGSSHIFADSRTKLYFKIPTLRYPMTVPQLLEEQPTAGIVVEANQLRKRLDRLRLGRGADCPDAWLHVQLAAGLLKMEGRSSSDGEQTVKADHLPYGSDAPGSGVQFADQLNGHGQGAGRLSGPDHFASWRPAFFCLRALDPRAQPGADRSAAGGPGPTPGSPRTGSSSACQPDQGSRSKASGIIKELKSIGGSSGAAGSAEGLRAAGSGFRDFRRTGLSAVGPSTMRRARSG